LPSEKCEVSSLKLPGHGLSLGFYDKLSVSSRNLSQVSVSDVTVSTTLLQLVLRTASTYQLLVKAPS